MSLLVANVVPEGLIFAADRNLSNPDGCVVGTAPKVLKWHDPALLVGYVGEALVAGEPMHEWLHRFLEQNATNDLRTLATRLADDLELGFAGLPESARGTIVHVGAFEQTDDGPLPAIWYIRDAEIQSDGSIKHKARFEPRDELKQDPASGDAYFGDATGEEIRAHLRSAQTPHPWAGYRQSFDLAVFGELDRSLWRFAALQERHRPPTVIEEWEPFMKLVGTRLRRLFRSVLSAWQAAGRRWGGRRVHRLARKKLPSTRASTLLVT